MNQSKLSSLVFGSRCDFSVRLGDDVLEVARDVADGDVLLGQLRLQARHLVGKALGQRANRLVLGLLDELALSGRGPFDGVEQLDVPAEGRGSRLADPFCGDRRVFAAWTVWGLATVMFPGNLVHGSWSR